MKKVSLDEKQLVECVLTWWEKHRFDTYRVMNGGWPEDVSVYTSEPEFVQIAKEIKRGIKP